MSDSFDDLQITSPWGEVTRIVDERDELRAENATLKLIVQRVSEQRREAELLYRGARDEWWRAAQERDRLRAAIREHWELAQFHAACEDDVIRERDRLLWAVLDD